MRRLLPICALFGIMAFLATDSYAQRPPFGGGGFGLLQNKGVQEELKITSEQKDQIAEKAKSVGGGFGDFAKLKDLSKEEREEKMKTMAKESREKSQKAIAEILKPEQISRLKQIERQQSVVSTLSNDEDVKKELKLSEEQIEKLKGISDDSRKEMQGLFGGFKDNPSEAREKMAALRKEATEKAVKVLDDAQAKKWKDLTGEPFEVKLEGRGNFGKGGTPPKKTDDN